VLSRCRAV